MSVMRRKRDNRRVSRKRMRFPIKRCKVCYDIIDCWQDFDTGIYREIKCPDVKEAVEMENKKKLDEMKGFERIDVAGSTELRFRQMPDSLEHLNNVFSRRLLEVCHGKKVLMTLTGGLDTRAMLSVLNKNKLPVDAVTYWRAEHPDGGKDRDVEITRGIVKQCQCIMNHLVMEEKWVGHCENGGSFKDLTREYDVVLMGLLMSETFDKFQNFHKGEACADYVLASKIEASRNALDNAWIPGNVFLPGADVEIQRALREVPLMYRGFGSMQRKIILLNQPFLMRFPYTCFNLRFRLFRIFYWRFISVIEALQ